MRYFLAIDIGASSGRHIVGWMESNRLQTKEVYRFPNGVKEENGHLIWDMVALLREVKRGIGAAKQEFGDIYSLSIDTWGVDYVLMDGEREILPVYAYRDGRTSDVISAVHEIVSFDELYYRTGCQFQPFNTIYQLYDDKRQGRLEKATDMLMIPEYLLYKLCGKKTREYTNATTTGLVSAKTGEYDAELLSKLGYPAKLFPRLNSPGTVIGAYEGIRCMLCGTHDTASAVAGIPMEGNHPYISSGTWSLLGIKNRHPLTDARSRSANYTNEGGIGYIRFQKNIMGMWIINELQRELCPLMTFTQIVQLARESKCEAVVDANASVFLSPDSMKKAFDELAPGCFASLGDYFRCAYRSLAFSYKAALDEMESITEKHYDTLYIVGGGAKNQFLNELTEEITGKKVIALPVEATALGNLKVQMEGI